MADGAYVYERNGKAVVGFELDASALLVGALNVSSLHIASAAEWYYRGSKIELTHEIFKSMVARFSERKSPLVVDYFHGSAAADPTNPEASAAAGWIHSMWITGEGPTAMLWASVEWTDRAAKMIRAKEMRFCSPEFGLAIPSVHDNSVGPELLSVALTNRPHQDNLQAILMTREPGEEDDTDKLESDRTEGDSDKPEPDSVPEGEGSDTKEMSDDAKTEGDEPAALEGDAVAETDPATTVQDDAAALMDVANAVAKELGIDLGSTVSKMQQGLTAIVAALGGGAPTENDAGAALFVRLERDQLKRGESVLLARVAQLEGELKAHTDKAAADAAAAAEEAKAAEAKRIADHVQMCIDQGRVHIGDRDDAIKAFTADFALADRIYKHVVVPVEQRAVQAGGTPQNLLNTKKFTRDELTPGEALAVDSLIPLIGEERAIVRVVELRRT